MSETRKVTVMFDGDAITTTVTSSGEAVEDWLDEVLYVHRRRLHKLVVGLDVEWRPSFSSAYSPTALLQLCVGRRCLVFQLLHADYFPDALDDFLGDTDFRFVGVGVDGDADRLSDDYELEVENTVDLRKLAADEMDRPDLRQAGLKAIASAVMGVNMEKPHWVRTGRWDAYSLSDQQIKYACIDAFVSFEVGRRLLAGDY
uniref:3'-5' exonuclease domain-containing protein n=1 Tax=Arundo donax TaxID=35708 RepID=A0A0A9H366_ARUDO